MKKRYLSAVLLVSVCLAVGCGKKADDDKGKKPEVTMTTTPTATPKQNKNDSKNPDKKNDTSDKNSGSDDDDEQNGNSQGQEEPGGSDPSETPAPTDAPSTPEPTPSEDPDPTQAPSLMELAEQCIGKTMDELMDACGGPNSSTYEEDTETGGEIGYHYYDGFTVSSSRGEDGTETVTGVW